MIENKTEKLDSDDYWDVFIQPKRGWIDIDFGELWHYRDLIFNFVKRDFTTFYKQTVLGPIWYIIQPLFTAVVFTVIFGKFAKIPTDGLPPFLFYLSGSILWRYFADSLTMTSNTFISNADLFGKVYFPRLTIPISIVLTNLFQFAIQFVLFICFYGYFFFQGAPLQPGLGILLLPLLLLQMALLGLGTGILISSMTTKYRDLSFALDFLVQLWMYASPIVYPLSQVPEKFRCIYILNPMVSIVECFRYGFLGTSVIQPVHILTSCCITIVVLTCGIMLFNRVEATFMDTI